MIGIYKITTLNNNKIYIGSSSISIKNRIYSHKSLLRRNKHHSLYLQNVYNKYGEEILEFSIVEDLSNKTKEYIIEREQYWLDTYKCYTPKNGYNTSILAQGNFRSYTKINQYTMEGTFIKQWNSARELAEELKVTTSSIYAVCNNPNLISIKGYQFRYELSERPVKNQSFYLCCYNKEGILLKNFNGYKEAANYFNIKLYSNIRRAVLEDIKCRDMYWKVFNNSDFPEYLSIPKKERNSKKVNKLTKENKFVAQYNSITEAAASVGSSIFSLSKVLSKKAYSPKTLKGYKWEYV